MGLIKGKLFKDMSSVHIYSRYCVMPMSAKRFLTCPNSPEWLGHTAVKHAINGGRTSWVPWEHWEVTEWTNTAFKCRQCLFCTFQQIFQVFIKAKRKKLHLFLTIRITSMLYQHESVKCVRAILIYDTRTQHACIWPGLTLFVESHWWVQANSCI